MVSVGFWSGSELARRSVCFTLLRREQIHAKRLAESARERAEYLKQKSREAAAQVNTYVDAGKDQFGDYVERGKQAVATGRSQVEDYVDRGRKVVAKHASKVSAAVDAGKNAYTATTSPSRRADLASQMDKSTQTLLVVFIAVAAVSILMQAGFTVAMFFGARKAQKKIMELADDVRLHALPAIMSSRELIQDVTPKLKLITENLTATTATLRTKADQVGGLVGRRNRAGAGPGFARGRHGEGNTRPAHLCRPGDRAWGCGARPPGKRHPQRSARRAST